MDYMEYLKRGKLRVSVNLPLDTIKRIDEFVKTKDLKSRKKLIETIIITETNKL